MDRRHSPRLIRFSGDAHFQMFALSTIDVGAKYFSGARRAVGGRLASVLGAVRAAR
jgi:hypothetical protein